MAYGINVWGPSNILMSDPQIPSAGLYIEDLNISYGSGFTKTYSNVPAGGLVVQTTDVGMHDWSVDSVGGLARFNATARFASNPARQFGSSFQIFATSTIEPSYGVMSMNASGQRLFSTLYPLSEFVLKTTVQASSVGGTWSFGGYSYRIHHSFDMVVPVGPISDYVIFVELPDSGQDVWFRSRFVSVSTGVYRVEIRVAFPSGVTPVLPATVLVFKVRNIGASGATYGLRVFDAAGNVTYDAGKRHMILKQLGTGFNLPTNIGSAATSTTFSGLSGNSAVRIPRYDYETWVARSGQMASDYDRYESFVRRSGSALHGKLIHTETGFEDAAWSESNFFGQSSGHVIPIVDPTIYPFL